VNTGRSAKAVVTIRGSITGVTAVTQEMIMSMILGPGQTE
jgi:hypothetical protein